MGVNAHFYLGGGGEGIAVYLDGESVIEVEKMLCELSVLNIWRLNRSRVADEAAEFEGESPPRTTQFVTRYRPVIQSCVGTRIEVTANTAIIA